MGAERAPWFSDLRQYVDGNGYEIVALLDGSRSAVPMDTVQVLAELDRAEKIADAASEARNALAGIVVMLGTGSGDPMGTARRHFEQLSYLLGPRAADSQQEPEYEHPAADERDYVHGGRMKAGPSNSYRRLLAGKITPERYIAILKRTVKMRLGDVISRPENSHAKDGGAS